MVVLPAVTEMDLSVALLTARVVKPDVLPKVAVIVEVPADTEVAFPLEPDALLTVATDVPEVQVTCDVRSCVLLSEYVPVAENCWDVPIAMLGLAGVTAMDTSVTGLTVRVVEPTMLPEMAFMVVVPTTADEAFPELLIVATDAEDELQATDDVRS
ncbi:MAG: hypothetical protein ABSB95_08160 [Dissulfurispiraceae bacterium]|jgi:hypothetical protein